MKRLSSYFASAIMLAAAVPLIQACNLSVTEKVEPKPVNCAIDRTQQSCLLQSASEILASIEVPFESATSAAELAIALDVSGKTDEAWNLIETAMSHAADIKDDTKRGTALADITSALSELKPNATALPLIQSLTKQSATVENATKQYDLQARLISIKAVHSDIDAAFIEALNLPEEDYTAAAYKAVTLRKIAKLYAQSSNFEQAQQVIQSITMSLKYYKAMARCDVARKAAKAGRRDLAKTLLIEAEDIARNEEDNGYFISAALRDVAYSYYKLGDKDKALSLFEDAKSEALNAKSAQEQARVTSRIATRLADAGLNDKITPYIYQARELAEDVEKDILISFTQYEIAGTAAFAGRLAEAEAIISAMPDMKLGSTQSTVNAAKRDLAWGYARQGEIERALIVIDTISTKREKVFALARIIRLMQTPEMEALPRYL